MLRDQCSIASMDVGMDRLRDFGERVILKNKTTLKLDRNTK